MAVISETIDGYVEELRDDAENEVEAQPLEDFLVNKRIYNVS